jgi:hypothetical protein
LFAHFSNLLNIDLAEFVFLKDRLTDDSIDHAIACFQEALHSHKALPHDFDTQHAQNICHRILQMTKIASTAISMVTDIPRFWANLDGLVQSSNLTAIETTMTRVFCMQGALKFHYWLLTIVPAAIRRTSNPAYKSKSWIDKLATDVRSALNSGHHATFRSSKYLPNLSFCRECTTKAIAFQYDITEPLTSELYSMLRWWLHFPNNEDSLTLLDIVLSKSPTSILFLDEIWNMYKSPHSTVFNNDWHIQRSKKKLTTVLEKFKETFALHPFAIPGSSSHDKLQHLSQVISQWMQHTGADSDTTEIVSFIMIYPY